MRTYGAEPIIAERDLDVECIPNTYLLYMPVKMPGSFLCTLPTKFSHWTIEMIVGLAMIDYNETYNNLEDKYVYLSYETSEVKAGVTQKRPGWHADGFMTDDINYIWYDKDPTLFNTSKFDVSQDHEKSIEQFRQQASSNNNFTLPCKQLIRMDQYVIHRAVPAKEDGQRTFIKISISDDKYNLKGNTMNPDLPHDWKMYNRQTVRNHPQLKEVDSVPDQYEKEIG